MFIAFTLLVFYYRAELDYILDGFAESKPGEINFRMLQSRDGMIEEPLLWLCFLGEEVVERTARGSHNVSLINNRMMIFRSILDSKKPVKKRKKKIQYKHQKESE